MNKVILFLLLVALASSCVDEITLAIPAAQQKKLAIVGSIRKQDSTLISVEITRSLDVTNRLLPDPESGAAVYIYDEDGANLLIPEIRPGVYKLSVPEMNAFLIKLGKSYRLSVQLSNGQTYESTLEPLLAVPKPDSLSFQVVERKVQNDFGYISKNDYVEVLISTPLGLDSSSVHLKWDFEGCYQLQELQPPPPSSASPRTCYINQALNLGKVVVFNGLETTKNRLEQFSLMEEPINVRFGTGFYFTVHQQSLSPGAYEYWNNISQIVSRTGSLFEPPAGIVKSNIYNVNNPEEEVLGYFYCTEVESLHKKVNLEKPYRPPARCAAYPSYYEAEPFCRDCLLWPNSTLKKPDYWE